VFAELVTADDFVGLTVSASTIVTVGTSPRSDWNVRIGTVAL
jgi:hypothetical protein